MAASMREGLLCPECRHHPCFENEEALLRHFSKQHAADKSRGSGFSNLLSTVQGLVASVTDKDASGVDDDIVRSHWKESEKCAVCELPFTGLARRYNCCCCGEALCKQHWGWTLRLDREAQIVPNGKLREGCRRCFEHYEDMMGDGLGVRRCLTSSFLKKRKKRASQLEIKRNRLIGRLHKISAALTQALLAGELIGSNRRTELEQSVVPWLPASKVEACPVCAKPFSLLSRVHHCRLCGGVVCDGPCSAVLPLRALDLPSQPMEAHAPKRKLAKVIGSYQLRCCEECLGLLKSTAPQSQGTTSQAHGTEVAAAYHRLSDLYRDSKRTLAELLDLTVRPPSTPVFVERAQLVRLEVKTKMKAVEKLSCQIEHIPLADGVVPNGKAANQATKYPQARAVQLNIKRAAQQFLQTTANQNIEVQQSTFTQPNRSTSLLSQPITSHDQKSSPEKQLPVAKERQRLATIDVFANQRKYLLEQIRRARQKGEEGEAQTLLSAMKELERELGKLGWAP